MQFLGTLINTGAIIIGGILGLILSRQFEKNARLREVPSAAMKAISVVVIVIGVEGAIESTKPIVLLLSMVIGTVIGTIINIDGALEKFGKNMERKFIKSNKSVHPELAKDLPQKSFSKAFISATLTCCVGALAITGALESGLSGGSEQGLLYTKSVLDFTTALVFSASYGGGAILAVCARHDYRVKPQWHRERAYRAYGYYLARCGYKSKYTERGERENQQPYC